MCRDSALPIDLFEGESVQHVPHLLFCNKEAAYTLHSSVLHYQLQLIRQTQFLSRFRMVLFEKIFCFHVRMSSVVSGWQVAQPITAVKESASPRCASLTAMLCCANRYSRRRCRHLPMKISWISRPFQSLSPIITRTNVRANAIMRGRASKSGVAPHRKNRAFRLTTETPCFHFWENPKPLFLLKCTQVFALAIEISHPHH